MRSFPRMFNINHSNQIEIVHSNGIVETTQHTVDRLIDGTIIDNIGGVLKMGTSRDVFEHLGGNRYAQLGQFRGFINIQRVYTALLKKNVGIARDFTVLSFDLWYSLIKTNGTWDLKNNMKSIYGLANAATTKSKLIFNQIAMNPEDVGNHHFGVITKAAGMLMTEEFILRGAGMYQMRKNPKTGTSTSELKWQRHKRVPVSGSGWQTHRVMIAPYGDDPVDQRWIKAGFEYYKHNY